VRIARLSKIRKHRIFRNFVWPNELPAFSQFNVIYGWNGTGKTTLSSLFAHLQDRRAILLQGEVEFELDDGTKISGANIPNATTPPVRVFNRDFVAKTIEAIGQGSVAPIYFLGEENIEKQKQVEALKVDIEKAAGDLAKAERYKLKADDALDDYCVGKAKLIKEALLGSPQHANYDKRRFKEAVARLLRNSPQAAALTDEQKQILRKQKELQAKPSISTITVTTPDLQGLHSQTAALLERSIVSQVIDNLASDSEVGAWVQQGLSLHKGERETDTCRFCGNELSLQRQAELEAHFNDAYASFQQEIEKAIKNIEGQQQNIANVAFPDESRFYDHLVDDVRSSTASAKEAIQSVKENLSRFTSALEQKKTTPFKALVLDDSQADEFEGGASLKTAIDAINAIIDKHESITGNLNKEVKKAFHALEQDYVLEALPKYDELNKFVTEAEATLALAKKTPDELKEQIGKIERDIVEHRRPAEELNHELRAYLGRDELRFGVKDAGYALTRGGQPASHLSEGERTAIAFLYFLKSLEDKAFDLSKGIVVIDDPVSSLDANALFSAFGYMKERTKACHQLFILTHNFAFFRQVKNWFHHIKNQNKKKIELRPARFYALLATVADGERSATISPIDPLLEQFESEYHFLFRQVHDVANIAVPTAELVQYYGLPNIARRLIETFLAHRFPDCSGDLIKRFDRVDFDPAKKTRILRLLNTYSHSGGISDPEHDPSVLAETGEVMKVILEMIEAVDSDHYQGMVKLMQPVEAEE
jgi:wobble nucleotide-excising tRNase